MKEYLWNEVILDQVSKDTKMGCSVTLPKVKPVLEVKPVRMNRSHSTENVLTEEQKRIIRQTWKLISNDMTDRGVRIFLTIFERQPKVRELFPFHDKKTKEELMNDARFRGHASRFMQAVGAAVENLDNLQQAMSPLLGELGRQHGKQMFFEPQYFDLFEDVMLETIREDLGRFYRPDVKEAWTTMINFLINQLRDGYGERLMEHKVMAVQVNQK